MKSRKNFDLLSILIEVRKTIRKIKIKNIYGINDFRNNSN